MDEILQKIDNVNNTTNETDKKAKIKAFIQFMVDNKDSFNKKISQANNNTLNHGIARVVGLSKNCNKEKTPVNLSINTKLKSIDCGFCTSENNWIQRGKQLLKITLDQQKEFEKRFYNE